MPDAPQTQLRPPRRLARLLSFLRSESTGGLVLMIAAAAALVWSNGPASAAYFRLLVLPIGVRVGQWGLTLPLLSWVNDGLMALFFLAVGLEIRRELTEGQLAGWSRAAAPGLAAFGGMIVPALIFLGCNWRDPATRHGWAVPVATDIAFALAALSVLGRRVPIGLRVFLTALAILDDLGAIAVIALFYTAALNLPALAAGLAVLGGLYAMGRSGVRALSPFVLGGALLWVCLFHGGVHPTLAGVGLAFVIPLGEGDAGPAHRLEAGLSGWITWCVLPVFGLTNAGLRLDGIAPSALATPLTAGIVLGLVLGKQIGVYGATLLGLRLGFARLPPGLTRRQLYGGAILCGIGFTMSLFIGDLGFHDTPLHDQVKLAVFAASLLSAVFGIAVLAFAPARPAVT